MSYVRVAAMVFALVLPFQAYAGDNIRKITVNGKSEVSVEAQYAVIWLEIRHVAGKMKRSHGELMETVSDLTKELKRFNVENKDIRKSIIQQGTEYAWKFSSRVADGFYSKCVLEVRVNDMGRIAEVYEALAKFKSITILDTEYKRIDEFDIREQEYTKALQAARKKAEHMARTMNAKIGKVRSIQEISSGDYRAANMHLNDAQSQQDNSRAGYGNIKISAQVVVEFDLM